MKIKENFNQPLVVIKDQHNPGVMSRSNNVYYRNQFDKRRSRIEKGSNVVDVSQTSSEGSFMTDITPANPILFPNLQGIVQHYRAYQFKKL